MNQGCRIDDTDIGILKSFRMVFGKELFRHCILVNTFANLVIADPGNREGTVNEAVLDYATDFYDALKEAGIPDIKVQPIHLATDEFEGILSIPAGIKKGDTVPFPHEWEKVLFKKIIKMSDSRAVLPLLKIKGLKKATVMKYLGITFLQDAIGMSDGEQTKRADLKIAVNKKK